MSNEPGADLRVDARHGRAAALLDRDDATNRVPADPPPTTPFDIAYQGTLLRLRHYEPEGPRRGPPVLLVYSFFKRPFVLDLVPERSVVRSFLREGLAVYLVDWLPPSSADAQRGLHDYVEWELGSAVDEMRRRERVTRVRLVGCCLGAFVAAVYAALHPENVERLVVFALPFESKPPFVPAMAEHLTRVYGNVPAWWIRAGLNRRIANPRRIPTFLATELAEPKLAQPADDDSEANALRLAFEEWLDSDVSFAGRLFLDIMGDAYGRGQFAASQLSVGGRTVALAQIRCPVLNICAEHDRLVPVEDSLAFGKHLGRAATNLVFACGHLGLMLSLPAHEHLWPHVAKWLDGDGRAVVAAGDSARTLAAAG